MKFVQSLIAVLVASVTGLGCGASGDTDPNENATALTQAYEGSMSAPVTITSYNKQQRLLRVVVENESLDLRLKRGLVYAAPANPIGPQPKCDDIATKWIRVLDRDWDNDKKATHIENELMPKLARNRCDANVSWSGDEITGFSFPLRLEY